MAFLAIILKSFSQWGMVGGHTEGVMVFKDMPSYLGRRRREKLR